MERAKDFVSLYSLQNMIKAGVESAVPSKLWVSAEIGEIKQHSSGHCYISLIDHDENDGINAKAQAVIWSSAYRVIKPYFESSSGRELSVGMRILVKVQIQYAPLFGVNLVISDIDPAFTVGELEMLRIKIIERLRSEGMFGLNAQIMIPPIPKRLAVISSESAAGYRDFMEHLHKNEYGFRFYTELFSAPMQGDSAPAGIISAMGEVLENERGFDLLLVLRGGGAAMDLIAFDDYELALNIAQYPLPVITAIGHDHDHHIADMVAGVSVKTPTALADYIIDLLLQEDFQVSSLASRLALAMRNKYAEANSNLSVLMSKIRYTALNRLNVASSGVDMLEQRVKSNNPLNLLERGYTFILKDGVRILSAKSVSAGDKIEIVLKDGTIRAQVEE